MKRITITNSDYSLSEGFAWVEFECDSKELSVQCCLSAGKRKAFIKRVNWDDSGMDWGLCGDANEKAVNLLGFGRCEGLLKKELRKIGIK